jgi:hypothetical protein
VVGNVLVDRCECWACERPILGPAVGRWADGPMWWPYGLVVRGRLLFSSWSWWQCVPPKRRKTHPQGTETRKMAVNFYRQSPWNPENLNDVRTSQNDWCCLRKQSLFTARIPPNAQLHCTDNTEFVLLRQAVRKLTTWPFRRLKISVQIPVFLNCSHPQRINHHDYIRL